MDSRLFRQNTHKTENNVIKIFQVFHDNTCLERITDLKLLCVQCHSKLGNRCFTIILLKGAYFLLALMAEGDEVAG